MYCRSFESYTDILKHGKYVDEVFFVKKGRVVIRFGEMDQRAFMVLPEYSVFGEWYCISESKADFSFTAVCE
jgi:hypothetical protein